MAIVFGTSGIGARAFGNARTYAYTVPSGLYRILVFGIINGVPAHALTNVRYGGVLMTQEEEEVNFGYQDVRVNLYYMVGPPEGAANLTYSLAGNCTHGCIGMTYFGVDPITPFRVPATATGNNNLITVNVASQTGDLVIDVAGFVAGGPTAIALGAGQTERLRLGSGPGISIGYGVSDEPGAPAVTMSWNLAAGLNWATASSPLIPFVGLKGRAVKYYYDLWDPKPSVKDFQAKVVPPDQLRSDAWIEMQGAILPESEVYDSFVQDQSKARIVEVVAKDIDATLKANKSQYAETIIKRAAAGRG